MTQNADLLTARQRLLTPAAFALLWILATMVVDDVTFHLAPFIVAASAAFPSRRHREVWAGLGLAIAISVTLLLSMTGRLGGPSLLPFGGAAIESVVGAVAGSLVGLVLAGRFAPATLSDSRP